MPKTIQIHVAGKVQGVYYRASAQQTALRLHVDGWVRNLADGSVQIVAHAEEAVLENFIAWCQEGPSYAQVKTVEVQEISISVEPGFFIR